MLKKLSFIRACMEVFNVRTYYSNYMNVFDVVKADSEELKEKAFRLRYEVYVEENGHCASSRTAQRIESDVYDKYSKVFLLIYKQTGKAIGTVRVILPNSSRPLESFPLQKYCDHPYLHMDENISKLVQISRLCISRDFRSRPLDGAYLPDFYDQDFAMNNGSKLVYINRKIPYAPVGLIGAAFNAAIEIGITDCVWALEREQMRIMRKLGLLYRTLGPRVDYLGKRQPFIFNIKHALDNMQRENSACAEIVTNRGQLLKAANELEQNHWHDSVFDQKCMGLIFDQMEEN